MGRVRGVLAGACLLFSAACSHGAAGNGPSPAEAPKQQQALEPASGMGAQPAGPGLVYVDPALGFEIARPTGDQWRFSPGEGGDAMEDVAVPVIIAHKVTGAQVVVQVAPAVATPSAFAERLTVGLRNQPGFTTTEIEPLQLADGAVGFAFTMGDKVAGRVAVVGGAQGHVYVLLATWPQDAPPAVISGVDEIVKSLKVTPV